MLFVVSKQDVVESSKISTLYFKLLKHWKNYFSKFWEVRWFFDFHVVKMVKFLWSQRDVIIHAQGQRNKL